MEDYVEPCGSGRVMSHGFVGNREEASGMAGPTRLRLRRVLATPKLSQFGWVYTDRIRIIS